jgi:hypothetical protein
VSNVKVDLVFEENTALVTLDTNTASLTLVSGFIGYAMIGFSEEQAYGFIGDDGVFYPYGFEVGYV